MEHQDAIANNSVDSVNDNQQLEIIPYSPVLGFKSFAINDISYEGESGIRIDDVEVLRRPELRITQLEETYNPLKKHVTRFQHKKDAMQATRQEIQATQQEIMATQAAQAKYIQHLISAEDARDASKHESIASEDERDQRLKELQDRCDKHTMQLMQLMQLASDTSRHQQRMYALGQTLASHASLIIVFIAVVGYAVFRSLE
ncbi:hypothetical protein SGCOL_005392 [Colletotrichum sp. CLE4]